MGLPTSWSRTIRICPVGTLQQLDIEDEHSYSSALSRSGQVARIAAVRPLFGVS